MFKSHYRCFKAYILGIAWATKITLTYESYYNVETAELTKLAD
jgi:hypothetical protein